VVWLADQAIPGAADAIARLRASGHDVVFVSNNSSATVGTVEDKLASFGIPASGQVVTSAVVAAGLVQPSETVLLFGGPGVREALAERGVTIVAEGPADVVVVGYHRDFNYERLCIAAAAIRAGARLVATNDDHTYPTPDGPIPGTGAILAAIATASGATPIVAGKPNLPMVDHVRRRLGHPGIMVGDQPRTDGLFAVALGYDFGLVLSGVTTAADLPVQPTPSTVAPDLRQLVEDALRVP
jgi:glycerol 3-phosphatase-2